MYRCVCIYETYSFHRVDVRIEVCQGNQTKSMSPFLRKVDLEDLLQSCIPESKCLIPLINQLGLIKQPFRFTGIALYNENVQELLRQNPWNGVQVNGKGSVKKNPPVLPIPQKQNISEGKLLGGEILPLVALDS